MTLPTSILVLQNAIWVEGCTKIYPSYKRSGATTLFGYVKKKGPPTKCTAQSVHIPNKHVVATKYHSQLHISLQNRLFFQLYSEHRCIHSVVEILSRIYIMYMYVHIYVCTYTYIYMYIDMYIYICVFSFL